MRSDSILELFPLFIVFLRHLGWYYIMTDNLIKFAQVFFIHSTVVGEKGHPRKQAIVLFCYISLVSNRRIQKHFFWVNRDPASSSPPRFVIMDWLKCKMFSLQVLIFTVNRCFKLSILSHGILCFFRDFPRLLWYKMFHHTATWNVNTTWPSHSFPPFFQFIT